MVAPLRHPFSTLLRWIPSTRKQWLAASLGIGLALLVRWADAQPSRGAPPHVTMSGNSTAAAAAAKLEAETFASLVAVDESPWRRTVDGWERLRTPPPPLASMPHPFLLALTLALWAGILGAMAR